MNSKKTEEIEMATSLINQSQRKAAKVAGLTFLIAIVVVIFSNYGITFRFIVPDASETARNILANQTLFRISIACNLIYIITVIVMFTSLYVILKSVNNNLALAAAFFRLIYALIWGFVALSIFDAMRLLGDSAYLSAFETNQLQTLSRLHIRSTWDAYYIGLPFWGLASAVCSYLWLKSRYIPRVIAVFGMISSLWCVMCAFIFIIFPDFEKTISLSLFDMPLVIFEITLGFWLLFKGLRPYGLTKPNLINQ